MSTTGAEVGKAGSRAAALAQLKFKRKKDVQAVQSEPVQSRFFSAEPATPRVPRVLVPDSSPSAPHNQPTPSSNPPTTTTKLPTGAWSTSRGLRDDTLSVPSFTPSTSSTSTSKFTFTSASSNGRDKSSSSGASVIDLDPDDGPPRKKPRPDLERIRSTRSDASSSAASVPPSSRVSASSTPTPTPAGDDPLSPVVGKLRKDVSRVTVATTSTSSDSDEGSDGPARRRVVRGRRKPDPVEEEELPSPRSLVKDSKGKGTTLESDNDEREGIIHIRSSPPPPLGGKFVNGKHINGLATNGKNGKTSTPSVSSKSTPNVGTTPLPEKSKPPPEKSTPKQDEDGASSGTEFDASDGDEGEAAGEWVADEATQRLEAEALGWFSEASEDALVEVTACTQSQAKIITSLRPFADIPSLRRALKRTKGVTQRFYDEYLNMQRGYSDVDSVLGEFEAIGRELAAIVGEWGVDTNGINGDEEGGLHLVTVPTLASPQAAASASSSSPERQKALSYLIPTQPRLLAPSVVLKDYQLFGISWLNLLYKKRLSCILADEMGLGKTCQVVAFLAFLHGGARSSADDEDDDEPVQKKVNGVHLVIVPSSTLENWAREFAKFAPSIRVATYYGSQKDRAGFREEYKRAMRRAERMGFDKDEVDPGWDVLITTYQLAQGAEPDRKFLSKSVKWETCVFDEGHVLKNFQSQRYQQLMKIQARWRLLLTGTPLQNNLQELVSLISFILPGKFTAETTDSLRTIFKVRADSHASLLSRERVSRAKTMMTPFVLRRRKDQVLKDLPSKTERIVWCTMTVLQRSIYNETMRRSKKALEREAAELAAQTSAAASPSPDPADPSTSKGKKRARAADTIEKKSATKQANMKAKTKAAEASSAHVLMDLRKAASHPMLFRRRFDDARVRAMAKGCLKEPEFEESVEALVVEDMEVMTDAELQVFAKRYKSVRKYALQDECFLDAGKVGELLRLLDGYRTEGRRVLVFSQVRIGFTSWWERLTREEQFTQILDILKVVLDHVGVKYLVLTGSTPVDTRQSLVDKFTEDESIPVFLLSTRAGGMGINLTAASVVIMFDQDFNPHNDRREFPRALEREGRRLIWGGRCAEAADRSYRIGQKRDVDVVKLITKETIEEDILRLGQTKLALDEAVAGDSEEGGEGATEKAMKASLLTVLRERFAGDEDKDMDLSNTIIFSFAVFVSRVRQGLWLVLWPLFDRVELQAPESSSGHPTPDYDMPRSPLPMRSPSPDPYPDVGTNSTQPQTQPQTLPAEPPEELVIHPDCWGLLVPCSSGQPSGVIQLTKRSPPAGAEPHWPKPGVIQEHSFKIGRGSANDFALPGQKISSQHCMLTWSGRANDKPSKENAVVVLDNSSNGTFINGKRIGKGKKSLLTPGDELSFGLPGQDIDDLDYRASCPFVPCRA
ncbi:hypothetical protein FRC10_004257 [Ceratobasidium sp. 414]|nr:hypothetical protein FRC10_004257 [Ceratobasidium sp. 414]